MVSAETKSMLRKILRLGNCNRNQLASPMESRKQ
jgi:hypothetical protein